MCPNRPRRPGYRVSGCHQTRRHFAGTERGTPDQVSALSEHAVAAIVDPGFILGDPLMPSYRNVFCTLGLITLLLTIAPVKLHAGELVQFDAITTDAGSLRVLGYLARPRGSAAGQFPAVILLHHCGGFDEL